MTERICLQCFDLFIPKSPQQLKYCSKKCRVASKEETRKRLGKRQPYVPVSTIYNKDCAFIDCGIPFTTKVATQLYCSKKCKLELNNRRIRTYPSRRECNRRSYRRHLERSREQNRAKYHNNKEVCSERNKRWHREHPEARRELSRRYRARKLSGTFEKITPEQWQAVIDRYDEKCAYCGATGKLTQDHVVPLSKGGLHSLDNIVPACGSCNSSKGASYLSEFLKRTGYVLR